MLARDSLLKEPRFLRPHLQICKLAALIKSPHIPLCRRCFWRTKRWAWTLSTWDGRRTPRWVCRVSRKMVIITLASWPHTAFYLSEAFGKRRFHSQMVFNSSRSRRLLETIIMTPVIINHGDEAISFQAITLHAKDSQKALLTPKHWFCSRRANWGILASGLNFKFGINIQQKAYSTDQATWCKLKKPINDVSMIWQEFFSPKRLWCLGVWSGVRYRPSSIETFLFRTARDNNYFSSQDYFW